MVLLQFCCVKGGDFIVFGMFVDVDNSVYVIAEQAAELMALEGAEENLELAVADLLDYGELTTAFHGCSAVFLTTPSSESLNGLKDYPVSLFPRCISPCYLTSQS
jgi:hypothetical protein